MNQFKVGFLINPISGGGRGREIEHFLPEIMASFGYADEEWQSELTDPDCFNDQIDRMLQKCDRLIAVGGDGTVNAVLERVVKINWYKTQVGLIPLGTGNDLGRILNIYKNFDDRGLLNTVRKLIKARSRPFDLWQINDKFTMAAYCSVGMDAAITHHWNADRSQGKIPGNSVMINKAWYGKVFFRDRGVHLPKGTGLKYRTPLQDSWHNKELSGYTSIIIGNIGSYGGGSNPFYRSNFADKTLEVLPVRSVCRFLGCMVSGSLSLPGRIFKRLVTPSYKAKEVHLQLQENSFVQIDGEDRTEELSGQKIVIKHAGQVEMLYLER